MDAFVLIAGLALLVVLIASVVIPYTRREGKAPVQSAWHSQPSRYPGRLWALVVAAIAFGGLFRFLRTLTGTDTLDGGIGVALGLYICAHPAANEVRVRGEQHITLTLTGVGRIEVQGPLEMIGQCWGIQAFR